MERYQNLTTQCVDIDNNIAWIFSNDFNGLFRLELETNELKYVRSFEEEEFFSPGLYTNCMRYNQKIAFIPCIAKKIAIYDTEKNEVKYIEVRDESYIVYFNTVPIDEKRVLLFPIVYSKKAYILDLENDMIETIALDYGNYNKKFSKYTKKPLATGMACLNDRAYFAVYGTSLYLSFDLVTHKIEIHEHLEKSKLLCITTNEDRLDFLPMDGSEIQSMSIGDKELKKITLFSKDKQALFSDGNPVAYSIIYPISKDEYLGIPFWDRPLCIASKDGYELIQLEWDRISAVNGRVQPFVMVKRFERDVYLFPYQSDTLVKINLDTKEISYVRLKVDLKKYAEIMDGRYIGYKEKMLYEYRFPLSMYLSWISKSDLNIDQFKQSEQKIGKAIHDKIMECLKD